MQRTACPRGIMGLNAETVIQYMQYIADRRLERLNFRRSTTSGTRSRG